MSLNQPISEPIADRIDPSINLEQVRAECQALAKSRAKISAGVAIIPVPFMDVAIDVVMLSKLLPEITAKFGLKDAADLDGTSDEARKQHLKERVIAIGGLVATRGVVNKTVQGFGGRIIGKQVAKYVPLGGQLVAASLGYMIFKKISFDHIEDCYRVAKQAQAESTGRP